MPDTSATKAAVIHFEYNNSESAKVIAAQFNQIYE